MARPKFKRRGRLKHKTKNPLRIDPSRTAGIRRQMILSLRERFARIKLAIANLIEREDAFGLQPKELPSFVGNARFSFLSSAAKLKAFQAWLRRLLAEELTGRSQEELWQRFIRSGYEQGAKRSFEDVRSKAIESGFPLDEQRLGRYLGNREEFLRSSFSQPVAREKVELLATRSFDDLEDITTTMSNRMSRVLASGMTRGISPREAAQELMDEVDISKGRAETIARTEIIRAHAQGQLMALEKLGVQDLGVMVEWSTTGDDKVCELCQPLEGVVLRIEEAQDMLPRHPNCRCAWIPANVDEDEEGQTRSKGAIDDALEESEELAGDGWGPGEDITKDRPKSVFNFSSVWNMFCATGPGGGIDPTCGKDKGGEEEEGPPNSTFKTFGEKPISPPRDQATRLVMQNPESIPFKQISLKSKFIPTQSHLSNDTVDSYEKSTHPYIVAAKNEPIILKKEGEKYIILDGHHRLAAALKQGNQSIDARVIE